MSRVPSRLLHFLGVCPSTGTPCVLPVQAFTELTWLLGQMGSGKTTAAIQLAVRLIGLGFSVIYIDLKGGSMDVHEALHIAARRRGCGVKRFSTDENRASHAMNPMKMTFWSKMGPNQQVQFLLSALGVEHDLAKYGESWFTTANQEVLSYVAKKLGRLANIREIAEEIRATLKIEPVDLPDRILRDGAHIGGALNRLSDVLAMQDTQEPSVLAQRIDFGSPFRSQEVQFYHLPVGQGGQLSSEIARFVCRGLLSAAVSHPLRHQTFCFVDEAQTMAGASLGNFMSQCRDLDIGLIVINQTPSQFRDRTVLANLQDGTRIRHWFGFGPDTQKWFEEQSGRHIDYLTSRTITDGPLGRSCSTTISETIVPYLNINQLKRVTGDPSLSVVEIVRGIEEMQSDGLAKIVKTRFDISLEEYRRRQQADWPEDHGMVRQRPLEPCDLYSPPPIPDARILGRSKGNLTRGENR